MPEQTKYEAWINSWLSVNEAYGGCDKATREMVKEFPELRRVAGYYHCVLWGRRTHWWCVTEDGEVVDPTASQFPSKGKGWYEEVTDFSEFPTGVCMDCGDPVYHGDTFCSPECETATRLYLGIK